MISKMPTTADAFEIMAVRNSENGIGQTGQPTRSSYFSVRPLIPTMPDGWAQLGSLTLQTAQFKQVMYLSKSAADSPNTDVKPSNDEEISKLRVAYHQKNMKSAGKSTTNAWLKNNLPRRPKPAAWSLCPGVRHKLTRRLVRVKIIAPDVIPAAKRPATSQLDKNAPE